ncbi:unnamed protein product, partial [Cladocopium goreaui]
CFEKDFLEDHGSEHASMRARGRRGLRGPPGAPKLGDSRGSRKEEGVVGVEKQVGKVAAAAGLGAGRKDAARRHVGQTGGASEAAGGGRVSTGGARKGWQWRAEPGKGDYRLYKLGLGTPPVLSPVALCRFLVLPPFCFFWGATT